MAYTIELFDKAMVAPLSEEELEMSVRAVELWRYLWPDATMPHVVVRWSHRMRVNMRSTTFGVTRHHKRAVNQGFLIELNYALFSGHNNLPFSHDDYGAPCDVLATTIHELAHVLTVGHGHDSYFLSTCNHALKKMGFQVRGK